MVAASGSPCPNKSSERPSKCVRVWTTSRTSAITRSNLLGEIKRPMTRETSSVSCMFTDAVVMISQSHESHGGDYSRFWVHDRSGERTVGDCCVHVGSPLNVRIECMSYFVDYPTRNLLHHPAHLRLRRVRPPRHPSHPRDEPGTRRGTGPATGHLPSRPWRHLLPRLLLRRRRPAVGCQPVRKGIDHTWTALKSIRAARPDLRHPGQRVGAQELAHPRGRVSEGLLVASRIPYTVPPRPARGPRNVEGGQGRGCQGSQPSPRPPGTCHQASRRLHAPQIQRYRCGASSPKTHNFLRNDR